jgi:hypothetical protein
MIGGDSNVKHRLLLVSQVVLSSFGADLQV